VRGPRPSQDKFALWLVPGGEAGRSLEALILRLAGRYGTPPFKPHVTLMGGLRGPRDTVLAWASRLASALSPFDLGLDGLAHTGEYYRCLFFRVKESAEVMGANALAREAFGREGDLPFMPHLSLMYGELPPSVREEALREAARLSGEGPAFRVSSLFLVSTSGEPPEWRGVRELPFSAP